MKPADFFDLTKFEHREIFYGLDYVWDALKRLDFYLDEFFKGKQVRTGRYDVKIEPFVNIAGHCQIGTGTVIEGPSRIGSRVIIGKNCFIRGGTNLRGNVIIGDNCTVGGEVKHSIVMNNSNKAHAGELLDSILGSSCNLAAQTGTMNTEDRYFQTNGKTTIRVKIGDVVYDTGLSKLGAVFGDGSRTNGATILFPGALLGKNCKAGAHDNTIVVPKGYYPDNSQIPS